MNRSDVIRGTKKLPRNYTMKFYIFYGTFRVIVNELESPDPQLEVGRSTFTLFISYRSLQLGKIDLLLYELHVNEIMACSLSSLREFKENSTAGLVYDA